MKNIKPSTSGDLQNIPIQFDYTDDYGVKIPAGSRRLLQSLWFSGDRGNYFNVTLCAIKYPGSRHDRVWGVFLRISGRIEGRGDVDREIELGDFYSVKFVRKLFAMIAKAEWSGYLGDWERGQPVRAVNANFAAHAAILEEDKADHEARYEARLEAYAARKRAKADAERKAFQDRMDALDRKLQNV